VFGGIARDAVHALKFQNHHAIAPMMARLMASRVEAVRADVVIPVPLHPSRRRERGYDQAALLARHLARSLSLPARTDVLRRVRKTRQQTTLDGIERRENVRGAFAVVAPLAGERVLLVDDVYTTGSTMEEAAHALHEAGSGSITAVVFARAD
jgi:ComF family protein